MSRLGITNMLIGFTLIFLAASGGVFIAIDTTQRFLEGQTQARWIELLQTASHGHTSLFGLIHIAMGVTLPYSLLKERWKLVQTALFFCGSMAMGPVMLYRASYGPSSSFEWNGILMGTLLSASLVAIVMHMAGLSMKLLKRA